MSIRVILEQLKKEKNPLEYLEKELKKTNDKELKKEIEKLIDKEKKSKKPEGKKSEIKTASNIPSLEHIAMSIPRARLPETSTERLVDYQSRARSTIPTSNLPQSPLQSEQQKSRQRGYSEDYGSNIKADYITTKSEFQRSLETSGLTTKAGFTTTAESKHAIQQRAGERKDYMDARDNLNMQQYSLRDEMVKEDLTGLSSDLKQAKRGRSEIKSYHG